MTHARIAASASLGAARIAVLALVAACARGEAPAEVAPIGPWLRIVGVSVRSADGAVDIAREGDAWRFADSALSVDAGRLDALERALRVAHAPVETRGARHTAAALGFGDAERLDVELRPLGQPAVRLEVGRADEQGTWVRYPRDPEHVHTLNVPLRRLLEGDRMAWRGDRLLDDDADAIVELRAGETALATRSDDGSWLPADGPDPVVPLHADRLVRGLASASGAPLEACTTDRRGASLALRSATRQVTFSLGGELRPGTWCLLVDGVPAFAVDDRVADAIRTARRALRPGRVPDLGSPDTARSLVVTDRGGRPRSLRPGSVERGFARAVFGLRPEAAAPPPLALVADTAPARTIVVDTADGSVHRILLWWHPDHPAVLARIDDSPPFLAREPTPLRGPLDLLTARAQ